MERMGCIRETSMWPPGTAGPPPETDTERVMAKGSTPAKTQQDRQVERLRLEVEQLQREIEESRKQLAAARAQAAAAEAAAATWERAHATLASASKTEGSAGTPSTASEATVWHKLMGFTTKQHCALQMLLAAQGNREIAERMGVQESMAKVYLRAMFGKLGVHSRSKFVLAVKPVFDRIPAAEYERAAGIPKTWHHNWTPADPYRDRYFGDMRNR